MPAYKRLESRRDGNITLGKHLIRVLFFSPPLAFPRRCFAYSIPFHRNMSIADILEVKSLRLPFFLSGGLFIAEGKPYTMSAFCWSRSREPWFDR